MTPKPRAIETADLAVAAQIWHDGWHQAHGAYMPKALPKLLGLPEFSKRLRGMLGGTQVLGPKATPIGFCAIDQDELAQIFIAKTAQGTGVAKTLLADGERRIAALGHSTAWLKVIPQNARAIAFYEKNGWHQAGSDFVPLRRLAGAPEFEVLSFGKTLAFFP